MNHLLHFFILLPLLGLLCSTLPYKNREKLIFWIVTTVLLIQWVGLTGFSIAWLLDGAAPVFQPILTYYKHGEEKFAIDLYFDKLTMVYGFIAGLLGTLISVFSRYYMHRDPGYKRFFSNMMFFFVGINLVIFSGNFETLFMGWEVLGISSFLLIGFYRERYLPVKNSIKVVSLYRLSDVMLLIALWLCHAAFGRNIEFPELQHGTTLLDALRDNPWNYYLVPIAFLIVAAVKSGQIPFSSWLPRAMEGPTTSSAIFYGSLSVHIGLFLMLRVAPLWMDNLGIRVLIFLMGVCTALISSTIANVQPTVKAQIAYASIAQIGVMFVEVALGWHTLALVHFAGNAILRSYQLLLSPSALNYLIHEQFYNFERPVDKISSGLAGRLRSSLYILSIKEFNLDRFQFHVLWTPFKWLGRRMTLLRTQVGYGLVGVFFILGLIGMAFHVDEVPGLHKPIAFGYAILAFLLIMSAFSERESAQRAWLFILVSHVFINLAISFNVGFDAYGTLIYLSGVSVTGIAGLVVLTRLERAEKFFDMCTYSGHIYEHPRFGLVFLIAALGIVGFPITPTFIGLDIVLSKIHTNQIAFLLMVGLSFVFMEIAALRIYARVFLGQHVKAYHALAFRNS